MTEVIQDSLQRTIDYVRISLTDRCNFRCVFCMPPEGRRFIPHANILRYAELLRLAQIFVSLGMTKFKVTGGEPLCRRDCVSFIEDLAALRGVSDVTLTTNGALLEPFLERLCQSGLSSITFSLPSFDSAVYQRITRSNMEPASILRTMDRAAALGFRVKTNTVPIVGFNEADIVPLARHALERGFTARFIEVMPVGCGKKYTAVPQKRIKATLEKEFGPLVATNKKMGNGPAKVYSIAGYSGYVGFIAAMTNKFCATCNRVRLTSTGFLKTCLHHNTGVDLKSTLDAHFDDAAIANLVRKAISEKPQGHAFSFAAAFSKQATYMNAIGG